MRRKPEDLKVAQLPEWAQIWDQRIRAWFTGYRTDFTKRHVHTFVKAKTFDGTLTPLTTESIEVDGYSKFLLEVDLDVTGAPTDIVIDVEFSDDNATFYKYMIGPFGDLRWEDSAGDKKECLDGPVIAKYMRLKLTSTGCTTSAYFLMNVKAILARP